MENLIDNRVYPEIKTGDSIEIEILPYITAKIPDIIRGIVIGISNRKSDTLIRLINVSYISYLQSCAMMRQQSSES